MLGAPRLLLPIDARKPDLKPLSDATLMMEFESLGDNVEFGNVQRACGAEPLGLFRFNTSAIANLCDVLERRLEELYEGDDLEIYEEPVTDQYLCRSRRYNDFLYHTLVSPHDVSMAAITSRERKKIGYLKRRLLDDLESGGKIFVRKGGDTSQDLRRLHKALSAYAPHVLLIVAVADIDHPPGTIERLGERLLRGFVSAFKVCHRPEPIDVASWLEVCRRAHRLIKPEGVQTPRKRLATGSTWTFSDQCDARPIGPSWNRRSVHKLRCGGTSDQMLASQDVSTVGLDGRDMVMFSAWARVTADFADGRIYAGFANVVAKHSHPIDLKRRDCWQRTWVTALVPAGVRSLTAAVYAEAATGASLELAGWTYAKASAPPLSAAGAPWRRMAWKAGLTRYAWFRGQIVSFDLPEPGQASAQASRRNAEALIARGAFITADDVLSEALVTFPNDAGLAKLYAFSAHNSGRYSAAVNRWNKALNLNPTDPMCFAGFASNLREHGDPHRAWNVISSALLQYPDEMVVLTEAARIAVMMKRPAEAFRLWDKTIALHGRHPEWVLARDQARLASGQMRM